MMPTPFVVPVLDVVPVLIVVVVPVLLVVPGRIWNGWDGDRTAGGPLFATAPFFATTF